MTSFAKPVSQLMRAPVHTVSVDSELSDVEKRLREHHISCLAVVGRDGKIAGVISHTDLLQLGHVMARATGARATLKLPEMCVGDVMTSKVIATTAQSTIAEASATMVERGVHRLFVVEEQRPVGVLSTRDVMRAVIEQHVATPISHYMTSPVVTVRAEEPLSVATQRLYESRVTGVVVLDGGAPAGVFTQVEALEARELPATTPVGEAVGYSMLCLPETTPLHRAANFALATNVRRVLVLDSPSLRGILTGLDFIRAAAA